MNALDNQFVHQFVNTAFDCQTFVEMNPKEGELTQLFATVHMIWILITVFMLLYCGSVYQVTSCVD